MRGRPFSETDRAEFWTRWRRGDSLSEIARALNRGPQLMAVVAHRTGGIPPRPRRRAARVLSLTEREEISRAMATGQSLRAIATTLQRAPSTISREVRRHGGTAVYRAAVADQRAWARARRPQVCRLARCRPLRTIVAQKLAANWSPQQIAAWLKLTYADPTMHVSHETIYRSLFVQTRGVLKQSLLRHLRRRRLMRRARATTRRGQGRGEIVDAVSIRERPAAVEDRAIPGHWEGDLLSGTKSSQIATLVERHSRYVMLLRVPSKETDVVVAALARHVRTLPRGLMRSLTVDRGPEFAAHHRFTVATNVQVYFCDPRSPWQRGSNENTNGLLRQYFPKGQDLSGVSQATLNRVARQLNERPRMTLAWQTPAAKLAEIVAATH